MMKKIAIIGAGAAGCMCAIELARRDRDVEVHVFEAGRKALAKVAVTGGGRCNVTNSFRHYLDERGRYTNLDRAYPRGDKLMRKALSRFSHEDAYEWFDRESVRLLTQEDECVFPVSQDAMEIVTTLLRLMEKNGVRLHLNAKVSRIAPPCPPARESYELQFANDSSSPRGGCPSQNEGNEGSLMEGAFDMVIVTTGGSPREEKLSFLRDFDLEIVPPVPSLFTFNLAGAEKGELMGTVVTHVTTSLAGTPYKAQGPLLWTHWGVSGPAILKLSSYAARHLAENDYKGTLMVNWCGDNKEEEVRQMLAVMMKDNAQKIVTNVYPEFLTQKHWIVLLNTCSIPLTQRWGALNNTHLNRLANILTAQSLTITDRCHYKEEFVTCGGVALSNINIKTMEAKKYPGLFFAGEVLDVDAITGGFNLQAAWSMAQCVATNGKCRIENGKL